MYMYLVIACNTHWLQVEEKVSKMQRRYFLQEQLKIIKRELGLEVKSFIFVWCTKCKIYNVLCNAL